MRHQWIPVVVLALLVAGLSHADKPPRLSKPIKICVGDTPIEVGSSTAPHVGDFDGDGLNDLLVGQGDGRLRIYRNTGTNQEPQFKDFEWFITGGAEGKIPIA